MKIKILTLFPDFFKEFLKASVIGRAITRGLVEIEIVNIRDFSLDKNHRVDDRPLGGGAGLIMRLEPLLAALNSVKTPSSHVILLSAAGDTYRQKKAQSLAKLDDVILICGHYEGVDYRFEDYVDESISIGDYVLTGGEIGAMAIADSLIRLQSGAISDESTVDESYNNGLLEYPQYTYPLCYEGKKVPAILLTGNHEAVNYFRHKEALKRTKRDRKDLLVGYQFTKIEKKMLQEIEENTISRLETEALVKGERFIKYDDKEGN